MRIRFAIALSLTLWIVTPVVSAQSNTFVLDFEGRALAVIDPASGKVESKVALPFSPDRALLSEDGKTLVVMTRGPGSTGFWSGEFRPTGKSSAAVVWQGKVVGSSELGWGLADAAFSKDGRSVYLLTGGYESNKPAERRPAELVKLDAATGAVAGRISFDRAADAFALDSTGHPGIVYFRQHLKKPTPLSSRLAFIDLPGWQELGSLELPGAPQKPVAVGKLLYLLDPGTRSAGGKLHIVDLSQRALAKTIDLGPEAVMGGTDAQQRLFVLSQGSDKKSGKVIIVSGDTVIAEHPAANAPKFVHLSEDNKRLFIAGWKDFSMVDLASNSAKPAVEQPREPLAVLATDDGRRAIVVTNEGGQCCRITVYDTESMKRLTSFLGGSKGERIGQGLAAAALTVASYQAGKSSAEASGSRTFYYSIYTPRAGGAARGPITFGPDQKKAYVVDTQTSDITVVDVATGQRIVSLDVGAGAKEVIPLLQAKAIAAISDESIALIDVDSDTVRETIPLAGQVVDAVLTPDEKRLVVFGKERVVIVDVPTAKKIAQIDSLKQPTQVLFGR